MSAALQRVLDETRQRFVDTFDAQCASIRTLVDQVDSLGTSGPVAALTQAAHRLSGLAGTIGFPTISARASEPSITGIIMSSRMTSGCSSRAFRTPSAPPDASITSMPPTRPRLIPAINRMSSSSMIWMTPFSSVAMLEKFALLKIAFCSAPVLMSVSFRRTSATPSTTPTGSSESSSYAFV